jgi:hypothetical protein
VAQIRGEDWVRDHKHERIYRWGNLGGEFVAMVDRVQNITFIDEAWWDQLDAHQRKQVLKTRESITASHLA